MLPVLGSFGSAVGRDDVHRNARRRRRIHTGSNSTSAEKITFNCFRIGILRKSSVQVEGSLSPVDHSTVVV